MGALQTATAESMTARLIAIAGPLTGSRLDIAPECSIGRAAGNRIVLDDRAVSRKQCTIVESDGGHQLIDEGGVNPTRVNGAIVPNALLRMGDQIEIGRSLFVYEVETAEPTEILDAGAELEATMSGEAAVPQDGLLAVTAELSQAVSLIAYDQALTAAIQRLLPAGRAYLTIVNAQGEPEGLTGREIVIAKSVVRRAMESRTVIAAQAGQAKGGTMAMLRISGAAAAPLLRGDQVIGVLYADRQDGVFTAAHVTALGELAAVSSGPLAALLKIGRLEEENKRLKVDPATSPMIGNSAEMEKVYSILSRVAPTDSTVLILGESGTGKEMVARALHVRSRRSKGPFLAVNCAAFPEALLESELFGHEKGAFTGAVATRRGLLEEAAGGTFFLDEIGEMPLPSQAKLLRVLQERQFQRVGGTKLYKADVRIVAATNRNLEQGVKERMFREDLLYRLKVISIELPPLRQRAGDIEPLARHFLRKHALRANARVSDISADALGLLKRYAWPGNVRELENTMERAVVLAETDQLRAEDFADLPVDEDRAAEELGKSAADWHARLLEAKRRIVREALSECGGRPSDAAHILGLHPNNFRRLLRQLNIGGLATEDPQKGLF
jgi:transcriptional regulator with GAF, ATPase, and Fis domain